MEKDTALFALLTLAWHLSPMEKLYVPCDLRLSWGRGKDFLLILNLYMIASDELGRELHLIQQYAWELIVEINWENYYFSEMILYIRNFWVVGVLHDIQN